MTGIQNRQTLFIHHLITDLISNKVDELRLLFNPSEIRGCTGKINKIISSPSGNN